MAHEKSEPKVGLIVKVAVLAIATIVILRFGLTSYFQTVEDDVRGERLKVAEKNRPKRELDQTASEAVAKSMGDIVKGGESAFVHPAPAPGKPAPPCWAAVKCKDAPAALSAAPAPTPKPPGAP